MRIDRIDIAKGFVIILVVMGHVLYMDLYGSDNAGQNSPFQMGICQNWTQQLIKWK